MTSKYGFEITFFESLLRRNSKNREVVEILGGLYTRAGRIDDGLKMDRKLVRLMPDSPHAHYNLACSLALKKRPRDAVRSLRKAISLGYEDMEWLLQDPDLENVKRSPSFKKLISEIDPEN